MLHMPSGTVTFLFTDIEGSTRLWEQHPEAMQKALARHDALLKKSIQANNGVVFKTVGDAFCAAFDTAIDALHAALAAQNALCTIRASAKTGSMGELQVRMALHSGMAEARDSDYFGPTLNRVARLLAIGHGGQVLLSEVTQGLVREALPQNVSLKELGQHRLRDLSHPERVFQLVHINLPANFPPLKSLDTLPTNLPLQLTSFIGREKEIEEVKQLLSRTRLLTLTGSGGCGKTRLALQVAADLLDEYPDGIWLVELASLTAPALVPLTVASILNVREEPGSSISQTLANALKGKRLLLVLDNCEHVLQACAQLANALLKVCPSVCILATSREGLGMAGEVIYHIPSLSVPDPNHLPPVENLLQYEAVRLFAERALAAQPAFALTPGNAPALAQLCNRLDGIPLAIELAAARVRVLTVEQVASRLDDRFRLLTGGSRTVLPRQQTLRALIDWSYDLLTDTERLLLERLAVFQGGWTLEAVEALCAGMGIEEREILDLLTSLVDKNLVVCEPQGEQNRYRLLETVRQYARERLMESGESATLRGRHRDYFLRLAEAAAPKLNGPEQTAWLERLETEHDNLRAALAWCLEEPGGMEVGLRLTKALKTFWQVRRHLSEGQVFYEAVLSRPDMQGHTPARALALHDRGMIAYTQGEYMAACSFYEESVVIWRELGDKWGLASALLNLGIVTFAQGDNEAARLLHEESLTLSEELGDKLGLASSLNNLGIVAETQGDYAWARAILERGLTIERELENKSGLSRALHNLGGVVYSQGDDEGARLLFEESLVLFRELGDRLAIGNSLNNLANIYDDQGKYGAAQALYEESLSCFEELENKRGIALALSNLSALHCSQGNYGIARTYSVECLTLYRNLGEKLGIARVLEGFANLAGSQGQPERASRLYGAVEALREVISAPIPANARAEHAHDIAAIYHALSEEVFATMWAEGRAMTIEQAIEYALEENTNA